jgi:hypothetical protein
MNKEDAIGFILSKSESGKDGMTVVRLGYVYSLIDKLFEVNARQIKYCPFCGCELSKED